MARRISPRLLVGSVVFVTVAGTLAVVYLTALAPQLKARRRIERELTDLETQWAVVQKNFGNNPDPNVELALLNEEIDALEGAVASLEKISEARLPEHLLPEEFMTEDAGLFDLRYEEYLEDAAEETEDRVKEAYRQKHVPLSNGVNFGTKRGGGSVSIGRALNFGNFMRGGGGGGGGRSRSRKKGKSRRTGIGLDEIAKEGAARMARLMVQEDLCYLLLDANIFALRRMELQEQVRVQDLRIFRFDVTAELSIQTFLRLAYLMREREAYYFFEQLRIEPVTTGRGARYFDPNAFEEMDELEMVATIQTLRLHTMGEVIDRRAQAKDRADKNRATREAAKNNVWLRLMSDLEDPDANKKQFGEVKPWWKFW